MMKMIDYKNYSGIYCIKNKINNKIYIGKTKNFYKRYKQYVSSFKNNDTSKINQYLLNSFCKNGFDCFNFTIIEFCDLDKLSERELFWMQYYNSTDKRYGYNLRMDSSTGMITHEKTKEKISRRLKKEWENGIRDNHSEKLKESWKNRDKEKQSKILSKNLTKYKYIIENDFGKFEVYYENLCKMGYKNVVSTFHKKNCNEVIFKNARIKRVSSDG